MPDNKKKRKHVNPDSWKEKIKSQKLWGKVLFPTFWKLLGFYWLMSFILIVVGTVMLAVANSINSIEIRYDNICSIGTTDCNLTFTPEITLKKNKSPKLYYKLDNFYGNHRNYIKSRSFIQLRGNTGESISNWGSIKDNEDIADPLYNLNGAELDDDDDANPCGLIAKYHFTDEFSLFLESSMSQIDIDDKFISQYVDRKSRFNRPSNYKNIQWADTEDEHLIVWYQPDAFPSFVKLWGKIETDLKKGTEYRIQINNQWDDREFDTTKSVFITETNTFGGDDVTFGVLYIVAGCVFFILACIMIVLEAITRAKRKREKMEHR